MSKIRCFEAFAGIGAQAEALKELGLDYEVVGISDIDKHAIAGYEAIHGPVKNYGDITKIEHLPECDLLTYSWPCTSISLAGKREGMIEGSGTASSLLWEVGRLLEDMKARNCLPEVLVAENVDAVLNRVNKPQFDRWINILNNLGYSNSYQIMNAKDYGTPQNRRRMFMVSTLHMGEFIFPDPCPDGRVLRDVLEDDVPESYFLSEKRLATFKRHKERNDSKGNGFGFKVHELTDEEREREGFMTRYTVTYCQYGDFRMKPTDIWTNHPNPQFKPACHYGDTCHVKAPRGTRLGSQSLKDSKERARIPEQLCRHIVEICENIPPGGQQRLI